MEKEESRLKIKNNQKRKKRGRRERRIEKKEPKCCLQFPEGNWGCCRLNWSNIQLSGSFKLEARHNHPHHGKKEGRCGRGSRRRREKRQFMKSGISKYCESILLHFFSGPDRSTLVTLLRFWLKSFTKRGSSLNVSLSSSTSPNITPRAGFLVWNIVFRGPWIHRNPFC